MLYGSRYGAICDIQYAFSKGTIIHIKSFLPDSISPPLIANILSGVIFFTLIIGLAVLAIPYGAVQPRAEAFFESGIYLITILWSIEGFLRGGWFVREHRLLLPVLFLALIMLFQMIPFGKTEIAGVTTYHTLSFDPYETQRVFFKFIALILFGALLWRYTSSQYRLRVLTYQIIIIGVASASFAIWRYTMAGNNAISALPQLQSDASFGQFLNRDHFAILMELTIGLLLGLMISEEFKLERFLIYVTLLVPVWVALVLSSSRGGVFSTLCQLVFFLNFHKAIASPPSVRHWRMRVLRIATTISAIVIFGGGSLWIGGSQLMTRLEAMQYEIRSDITVSETGSNRRGIWRATWKLIKTKPLLGVGFGGYENAVDQSFDPAGETSIKYAHNEYLEILASGGIICAGLSLWFIIGLGKFARRAFNSPDRFRRAIWLGAVTSLFSISIHSLVEYGLHVTINLLVLIVMFVLITKCDGDLTPTLSEEPEPPTG